MEAGLLRNNPVFFGFVIKKADTEVPAFIMLNV